MNDTKFCKFCGTDASPSARYCKNCGAELSPTPPVEEKQSPPPRVEESASPPPPVEESPSTKPQAEEKPSPPPPAEESSVDAKNLVNDGISLYQQGDYEGALKKFIKATEVDAKLVAAWSNKGCALGRLGNCVGAISAFNRALDIDPNNPEAKEGKELCQRMMSSQPQPVEG